MERRVFLKFAAGIGAGWLAPAMQTSLAGQAPAAATGTVRLKQSVTRGVFGRGADFEETCKLAASLGFKGYDLINSRDWPTLKKYGLVSTMAYGAPSAAPAAGRAGAGQAGAAGRAGAPGAAPAARGAAPAGPAGAAARGGVQTGPNVANRSGPARPSSMELNDKENHDEQEKLLGAAIDEAAANGVPNIIVFSGYRTAGGMSDQEAADNCGAFLNRVKAHAEDKGVNLCMELLNSRVNHRGYIFDHMDWGVEVMKRVDSPRVGILYDIYHAQIDDGDVVRAIRNNIQWIKHFHTAGNPGRNQLDDNQELNYRFIARAIADLNYTGYIGHEYSPTQGADPAACLKQAFEIFDI
jgi:hydroxypyruvate isomerase